VTADVLLTSTTVILNHFA